MAFFDMEILIRVITIFNNCRDVGMSDIILSYRFREFTGADITDILVDQPFPEPTEPRPIRLMSVLSNSRVQELRQRILSRHFLLCLLDALNFKIMMREYERVYYVKPEPHRFCVDN